MVSGRARRGEGGFMMLDVSVAMILLTGAVFTCVWFYHAEVRSVRATHERMVAQLVAESEIERLRALEYDRIPLGAGQKLELALPSAEQLCDVSATLDVATASEGLKQAVVRVQWRSQRGNLCEARVCGLFSKQGDVR